MRPLLRIDPPIALRAVAAAIRPAHRMAAALLIALIALAPPLQAQGAREYVVELVLFEHLGAQAPGRGSLWAPAPRAALTLGTDRAKAAGFEPLDASRQLDADVQAMNASGRYRVLEHLLWLQPGLAEGETVSVAVQIGAPVRLYIADGAPDAATGAFLPAALAPRPDRPREITTATLSGTLEVRLGRFLHLHSRLVYTDSDTGRSYRLDESRKMRRNELHYLDNPRFGILTRIRRAEDVLPGADVVVDGPGAQPAEQDVAPGGTDG